MKNDIVIIPKEWAVKYIDIERRNKRYPFFKCVTIVTAESRKEAKEEAQKKFPLPKYIIKSASVI